MRQTLIQRATRAIGIVPILLFASCFDESRGRSPHTAPHATFTFYTAAAATTPQYPLWAAWKRGQIADAPELTFEFWKDADALKTVMLSGKGDIWLGHTEAFALAKARGAPLKFVAVSGWRKFYLLSSAGEINEFADVAGRNIASTPKGSPVIPLMKAILTGRQPAEVSVMPAPQLLMQLQSGKVQTAVAPEPIVTLLLKKIPALTVIGSVEEAYLRRVGDSHPHVKGLPIAGIAVHENTLAKFPDFFEALVAEMTKQAEVLAKHPQDVFSTLPKGFAQPFPRALVEASLERDVLHVQPACAVSEEIAEYLRAVLPDLAVAHPSLVSELIWKSDQCEASY